MSKENDNDGGSKGEERKDGGWAPLLDGHKFYREGMSEQQLVEAINSWAHHKAGYVDEQHNAGIAGLTSELYSQSNAYIYELLQNVRDAQVTSGVCDGHLRISVLDEDPFGLCKSAIIMTWNERGWSTRDVEGVCNIGSSTKSDSNRLVGEKGIGFKAVFGMAVHAHILSYPTGFFFRLSNESKKGESRCICPWWINNHEKLRHDLDRYTRLSDDFHALHRNPSHRPVVLILSLSDVPFPKSPLEFDYPIDGNSNLPFELAAYQIQKAVKPDLLKFLSTPQNVQVEVVAGGSKEQRFNRSLTREVILDPISLPLQPQGTQQDSCGIVRLKSESFFMHPLPSTDDDIVVKRHVSKKNKSQEMKNCSRLSTTTTTRTNHLWLMYHHKNFIGCLAERPLSAAMTLSSSHVKSKNLGMTNVMKEDNVGETTGQEEGCPLLYSGLPVWGSVQTVPVSFEGPFKLVSNRESLLTEQVFPQYFQAMANAYKRALELFYSCPSTTLASILSPYRKEFLRMIPTSIELQHWRRQQSALVHPSDSLSTAYDVIHDFRKVLLDVSVPVGIFTELRVEDKGEVNVSDKMMWLKGHEGVVALNIGFIEHIYALAKKARRVPFIRLLQSLMVKRCFVHYEFYGHISEAAKRLQMLGCEVNENALRISQYLEIMNAKAVTDYFKAHLRIHAHGKFTYKEIATLSENDSNYSELFFCLSRWWSLLSFLCNVTRSYVKDKHSPGEGSSGVVEGQSDLVGSLPSPGGEEGEEYTNAMALRELQSLHVSVCELGMQNSEDDPPFEFRAANEGLLYLWQPELQAYGKKNRKKGKASGEGEREEEDDFVDLVADSDEEAALEEDEMEDLAGEEDTEEASGQNGKTTKEKGSEEWSEEFADKDPLPHIVLDREKLPWGTSNNMAVMLAKRFATIVEEYRPAVLHPLLCRPPHDSTFCRPVVRLFGDVLKLNVFTSRRHVEDMVLQFNQIVEDAKDISSSAYQSSEDETVLDLSSTFSSRPLPPLLRLTGQLKVAESILPMKWRMLCAAAEATEAHEAARENAPQPLESKDPFNSISEDPFATAEIRSATDMEDISEESGEKEISAVDACDPQMPFLECEDDMMASSIGETIHVGVESLYKIVIGTQWLWQQIALENWDKEGEDADAFVYRHTDVFCKIPRFSCTSKLLPEDVTAVIPPISVSLTWEDSKFCEPSIVVNRSKFVRWASFSCGGKRMPPQLLDLPILHPLYFGFYDANLASLDRPPLSNHAFGRIVYIAKMGLRCIDYMDRLISTPLASLNREVLGEQWDCSVDCSQLTHQSSLAVVKSSSEKTSLLRWMQERYPDMAKNDFESLKRLPVFVEGQQILGQKKKFTLIDHRLYTPAVFLSRMPIEVQSRDICTYLQLNYVLANLGKSRSGLGEKPIEPKLAKFVEVDVPLPLQKKKRATVEARADETIHSMESTFWHRLLDLPVLLYKPKSSKFQKNTTSGEGGKVSESLANGEDVSMDLLPADTLQESAMATPSGLVSTKSYRAYGSDLFYYHKDIVAVFGKDIPYMHWPRMGVFASPEDYNKALEKVLPVASFEEVPIDRDFVQVYLQQCGVLVDSSMKLTSCLQKLRAISRSHTLYVAEMKNAVKSSGLHLMRPLVSKMAQMTDVVKKLYLQLNCAYTDLRVSDQVLREAFSSYPLLLCNEGFQTIEHVCMNEVPKEIWNDVKVHSLFTDVLRLGAVELRLLCEAVLETQSVFEYIRNEYITALAKEFREKTRVRSKGSAPTIGGSTEPAAAPLEPPQMYDEILLWKIKQRVLQIGVKRGSGTSGAVGGGASGRGLNTTKARDPKSLLRGCSVNDVRRYYYHCEEKILESWKQLARDWMKNKRHAKEHSTKPPTFPEEFRQNVKFVSTLGNAERELVSGIIDEDLEQLEYNVKAFLLDVRRLYPLSSSDWPEWILFGKSQVFWVKDRTVYETYRGQLRGIAYTSEEEHKEFIELYRDLGVRPDKDVLRIKTKARISSQDNAKPPCSMPPLWCLLPTQAILGHLQSTIGLSELKRKSALGELPALAIAQTSWQTKIVTSLNNIITTNFSDEHLVSRVEEMVPLMYKFTSGSSENPSIVYFNAQKHKADPKEILTCALKIFSGFLGSNLTQNMLGGGGDDYEARMAAAAENVTPETLNLIRSQKQKIPIRFQLATGKELEDTVIFTRDCALSDMIESDHRQQDALVSLAAEVGGFGEMDGKIIDDRGVGFEREALSDQESDGGRDDDPSDEEGAGVWSDVDSRTGDGSDADGERKNNKVTTNMILFHYGTEEKDFSNKKFIRMRRDEQQQVSAMSSVNLATMAIDGFGNKGLGNLSVGAGRRFFAFNKESVRAAVKRDRLLNRKTYVFRMRSISRIDTDKVRLDWVPLADCHYSIQCELWLTRDVLHDMKQRFQNKQYQSLPIAEALSYFERHPATQEILWSNVYEEEKGGSSDAKRLAFTQNYKYDNDNQPLKLPKGVSSCVVDELEVGWSYQIFVINKIESQEGFLSSPSISQYHYHHALEVPHVDMCRCFRTRDHLRLCWPEVEGASGYELRCQYMPLYAARYQPDLHVITQLNQITLPISDPKNRTRPFYFQIRSLRTPWDSLTGGLEGVVETVAADRFVSKLSRLYTLLPNGYRHSPLIQWRPVENVDGAQLRHLAVGFYRPPSALADSQNFDPLTRRVITDHLYQLDVQQDYCPPSRFYSFPSNTSENERPFADPPQGRCFNNDESPKDTLRAIVLDSKQKDEMMNDENDHFPKGNKGPLKGCFYSVLPLESSCVSGAKVIRIASSPGTDSSALIDMAFFTGEQLFFFRHIESPCFDSSVVSSVGSSSSLSISSKSSLSISQDHQLVAVSLSKKPMSIPIKALGAQTFVHFSVNHLVGRDPDNVQQSDAWDATGGVKNEVDDGDSASRYASKTKGKAMYECQIFMDSLSVEKLEDKGWSNRLKYLRFAPIPKNLLSAEDCRRTLATAERLRIDWRGVAEEAAKVAEATKAESSSDNLLLRSTEDDRKDSENMPRNKCKPPKADEQWNVSCIGDGQGGIFRALRNVNDDSNMKLIWLNRWTQLASPSFRDLFQHVYDDVADPTVREVLISDVNTNVLIENLANDPLGKPPPVSTRLLVVTPPPLQAELAKTQVNFITRKRLRSMSNRTKVLKISRKKHAALPSIVEDVGDEKDEENESEKDEDDKDISSKEKDKDELKNNKSMKIRRRVLDSSSSSEDEISTEKKAKMCKKTITNKAAVEGKDGEEKGLSISKGRKSNKSKTSNGTNGNNMISKAGNLEPYYNAAKRLEGELELRKKMAVVNAKMIQTAAFSAYVSLPEYLLIELFPGAEQLRSEVASVTWPFLQQLITLGYVVGLQNINASKEGWSAVNRQRVMLLASRFDVKQIEPISALFASESAASAISDLESLPVYKIHRERSEKAYYPRADRYEDVSSTMRNHKRQTDMPVKKVEDGEEEEEDSGKELKQDLNEKSRDSKDEQQLTLYQKYCRYSEEKSCPSLHLHQMGRRYFEIHRQPCVDLAALGLPFSRVPMTGQCGNMVTLLPAEYIHHPTERRSLTCREVLRLLGEPDSFFARSEQLDDRGLMLEEISEYLVNFCPHGLLERFFRQLLHLSDAPSPAVTSTTNSSHPQGNATKFRVGAGGVSVKSVSAKLREREKKIKAYISLGIVPSCIRDMYKREVVLPDSRVEELLRKKKSSAVIKKSSDSARRWSNGQEWEENEKGEDSDSSENELETIDVNGRKLRKHRVVIYRDEALNEETIKMLEDEEAEKRRITQEIRDDEFRAIAKKHQQEPHKNLNSFTKRKRKEVSDDGENEDEGYNSDNDSSDNDDGKPLGKSRNIKKRESTSKSRKDAKRKNKKVTFKDEEEEETPDIDDDCVAARLLRLKFLEGEEDEEIQMAVGGRSGSKADKDDEDYESEDEEEDEDEEMEDLSDSEDSDD